MILFLHIRRTRNVGDLAACPAPYFDWADKIRVRDVDAYLSQENQLVPDVLVVGGGVWRHDYRALAVRTEWVDVKKVAWGIGVNYRRPGKSDKNSHKDKAELFDLYGHRDEGLEGRLVPCASCMHPAFDDPPKPEHPVVYYGHHDLLPLDFCRDFAPWRTNGVGTIDESIRFLASGETIVTSSYHGVYWGRLLGRRVIPLPRSSKFWHIPETVDLEEDRELNRAFFRDIQALRRRP